MNNGFGTSGYHPDLPLRMVIIPTLSVMIASMLPALPMIVSSPLLPPFGFLLLLSWRLIRSDVWPVWIGVPLGFWDDLMSGQPVGSAVALWTAVMLAMDALDTRVVWRDYWIDWVIGGVALAFVLIGGALLARAGDAADILRLVGPQYGISLFLLPLAMYLTGWLDRWRLGR